jgi:hypothetical protein
MFEKGSGMRTELTENTLTLYPEGHVDSKNAGDFERVVMAAMDTAREPLWWLT